jgi:NAD+ kinase
LLDIQATMKTVGILFNASKPQVAELLPRIAQTAKSLGIKLITCQPHTPAITGIEQSPEAEFTARMDALITLGGDGTLLQSVRLINREQLPVLGINLGRLGFLTSATEAQIEESLHALVSGNYRTSARTMLEANIKSGSAKAAASHLALNDIVIGWGQSTRIVTLDVAINDEPVTSYRCDGIIVSTPTGSTGHSLSAGGPIIHPEAPAVVLNVVCPHTLSARPLVIPDDAEIKIVVKQTGKELLLSIDGQDSGSLAEGAEVLIRKSARRFHLAHLEGYSYFSVLRQKLRWSGSSA